MAKTQGYVYEKIYSDLHGVNFSEEVGDGELAFAVNMYRDREGSGGMESIPGYRRLATLPEGICAIHRAPGRGAGLLIHAGRGLYRFDPRDEGSAPVKVEGEPLATCESRTATVGEALYLTDGAHFGIYRDGVLSYGETAPYIPTVRSDGEDYEDVNLFTPLGREEYHLYDLAAHPHRTEEGMLFTVDADGVCLVSGYTGSEERLLLPTEGVVAGRTYAVTGVASDAFRKNATVREIVLPEGYTHLGVGAFADMSAIEVVVLPSTLREIPAYCFQKSSTVKNLYVAEGIPRCNESALYGATVKTIHYTGDALALMQMEGYEVLLPPSMPEGRTMRYRSRYEPIDCRFAVSEAVSEVVACTLDGLPLSGEGDLSWVAHTAKDGETVDYIVLRAPQEATLYGKTLSLTLRYADVLAPDLRAHYPAFTGSGADLVNGCRLIARFDGRLFLSGHPDLPGLVLYASASEPTHFGRYQYFIDGDGGTEVTALLPTATHLLVLTATPAEGATVLRHVPESTGSDLLPRIYPVAEALGDRGCLGAALLFLDDPLYLSQGGLEAVEAVSLSLASERCLAHRSSAVDARLCREDLHASRLFRFGCYIGILTGDGRIYLGDGYRRMRGERTAPYEWYYLEDVGEYVGQMPRYRTATSPLPAALRGALIPMADGGTIPLCEPTERGVAMDGYTAFSALVGDAYVTYVIKDGVALPVECDGEHYGGEFYGASAILEADGLLCFGTGAGGLFAFNTDKREADGHIPARYYSFNGRAYRTALATAPDDGGMPTLRKSTVRGGAVRMRAMAGCRVAVLASVDGGPFREADTLYCGRRDFGETDFAVAAFTEASECVLPLRAAARRYASLQLLFTTEEYQRPFGMLSVAYRYRAAGRI